DGLTGCARTDSSRCVKRTPIRIRNGEVVSSCAQVTYGSGIGTVAPGMGARTASTAPSCRYRPVAITAGRFSSGGRLNVRIVQTGTDSSGFTGHTPRLTGHGEGISSGAEVVQCRTVGTVTPIKGIRSAGSGNKSDDLAVAGSRTAGTGSIQLNGDVVDNGGDRNEVAIRATGGISYRYDIIPIADTVYGCCIGTIRPGNRI